MMNIMMRMNYCKKEFDENNNNEEHINEGLPDDNQSIELDNDQIIPSNDKDSSTVSNASELHPSLLKRK
jgi:hypothetical protein